MITPGQPCSGCDVPMMPAPRRYTPPPAGMRNHRGHGLCSGCRTDQRVPGRLTAARRGSYVEPADSATVLRVIEGEHLPTNVADRREAALLLTRSGESAASIARRIGVAQRTVVRYRASARAGGAA